MNNPSHEPRSRAEPSAASRAAPREGNGAHDACTQTCRDGRRTFCKMCIGGMAATSAAMVGFPVVSFLALPERLGANKPVEVPLDKLIPGQAQYVDLRGQQLIVLAASDGPRVYSASCPHLGCNVIWDTGDGIFRCPCHGAIFDAAGQVTRGPVSAPLQKIPFEVKDGKIIIA